jgi:asparagine synthase (glutamine-hydrolysing)
MSGKEFHTYSAIFDHPETCVESHCIQSLTKDLGANAHFVSVPSFQGMASVEELIDIAWTKAHPTDNSILLPMMMCQAASRNQHRVMLNGVSGDLTMYVPNRYPAYLMRDGQWRQAWQECQGASRNNTYLRESAPLKLWLLNVGTAYLPEQLKPLARRLRGQRSPLAHSVIKPAFAQRLHLAERLRIQQSAEGQPKFGNIRQTHAEVINSPILGIVLGLTGYEHMAGRFGVELRDPWADRRVVEFFLRLPLRFNVRDGWTKYLVRSAFGNELEAKVRQRLGKEHLGWHFASRLMRETPGFVSKALEINLDHTLGDYVDLDALRTRYQNFQTKGDDEERDFFYEVMALVLWLRRIAA